MTKTLADFRAEKGLYLKDLAETLEMTEDEFRAIEESGVVPEEIGQRLILQYSLPADYFAEPDSVQKRVNPLKKTPANPMRHFILVSFVAMFICDLVAGLPSYLNSVVRMIISYISTITYNEIKLSETGPLWDIFDTSFNSVVIVLFGIFFVKYITGNTTFEGNIKKYRFFYYSWPFVVGGFVLDIAGIVSTLVLLEVQKNFVSVAGAGITLALSSVVSILSIGISVLAAYFCARLLNAAAFGDETKQIKEFRFLATWVTISTIISLTVFVIRTLVLKDFSILSTVTTLLAKFITVAVIWIAATVKPKDEKQEKLIFTILPIVAMCDSIIYGIIHAVAG